MSCTVKTYTQPGSLSPLTQTVKSSGSKERACHRVVMGSTVEGSGSYDGPRRLEQWGATELRPFPLAQYGICFLYLGAIIEIQYNTIQYNTGYLPGMNLISRRQVVYLCNGQNKTFPWQEYINPAKERGIGK